MTSPVPIAFLCASLFALACISLVALRNASDLHRRVSLIEKNKTLDKETIEITRTQVMYDSRASHGNTFYAGVDTRVQLDKSIFGQRLYMDLDEYDVVHPAVLAKGAVVVQGSGRLVLDGDASDLIMKIDNEYFSLRELFGIGRGIDTSPRPEDSDLQSASSLASYNYLIDICKSTDLLRGGSCQSRRNFGVDSCLNLQGPTTCYCGGGYDPKHHPPRHFVVKSQI